MKKSYFMRTFEIDGYLLMISALIFVIEFLFKMLGTFLHSQANTTLIEYTQFMEKYVMIVYHGLQQAFAVIVLITFSVILPKIVTRVWKDSIMNVSKSIWLTTRIRKFLQMRATYEEEENRIFRYNKAIKKAIIDVRNDNVVFVVKLPNELSVHSMILGNKDSMREEIANRLPDYSFSNIQRVKGYLRLEGTKII